MELFFYKTRILIFILLSLRGTSAFAGEKALVVMDVQEFFVRYWGAHWRFGNPERLLVLQQKQVDLIQAVKAKRIPILVVEMWDRDGQFKFGPTQSYIWEAIGDYEKVKTVRKSKESLFHDENEFRDQALGALKDWNVDELILIGANGSICIRYTMQDALKRGFKVTAFTPGIIDMAYSSNEFTYPFSFQTWFETKNDFFRYQRQGLQEKESIDDVFEPQRFNQTIHELNN